jgi:glycosyltransferase involved in cell wall biosynthesis
MLSILFVLPEYAPEFGGGIISFYGRLLPRLVAEGVRVHVLVANDTQLDLPQTRIEGVEIEYLTTAAVTAARLGYDRFRIGHPTLHRFLPLALAAYERSRMGDGFDVVEVTDWQLLFLPWIAMGSRAVVNVSLHGSCGQLASYDPSPEITSDADFVRLLEAQGLAAADHIQANSRANAREWIERTRREVEVIPPIADGESTTAPQVNGSSCGLVVGRLQWWKGPQVLCEALRMCPDIRLRWIGRDSPHPASGLLMSDWLRKEYPDIFGRQLLHHSALPAGQVAQEIASAPFVCAPSTWDVFNLTVIEAMEAGVPVVCSTRAGAAMLIKDGVNGFLADPADAGSFARAFRKVLALTPSTRALIGRAAMETVQRDLSPERITPIRLESYERIARARRHQRSPDHWLRHAVAPRFHQDAGNGQLHSYPARVLASAAMNQALRGLKRRFESLGAARSGSRGGE